MLSYHNAYVLSEMLPSGPFIAFGKLLLFSLIFSISDDVASKQ